MNTCPRRLNELGPWEHISGLDRWTEEGTCSFCGSLSPEEFFKRVDRGDIVTPTDKNYKAYIDAPDLRSRGKIYFQHFEKDDREKLIELLNSHKLKFSYPGFFYVLPFFVYRASGPGVQA